MYMYVYVCIFNIAFTCDDLVDDTDTFMLCTCAMTSRHDKLSDIWRRLLNIEDYLGELRDEHYKEASLKQVKVLYKVME